MVTKKMLILLTAAILSGCGGTGGPLGLPAQVIVGAVFLPMAAIKKSIKDSNAQPNKPADYRIRRSKSLGWMEDYGQYPSGILFVDDSGHLYVNRSAPAGSRGSYIIDTVSYCDEGAITFTKYTQCTEHNLNGDCSDVQDLNPPVKVFVSDNTTPYRLKEAAEYLCKKQGDK